MDKHESIRPDRDSVGRYSAIKGGSSLSGHYGRNLKLISLSVPLLQCGAFASLRSRRTSRWYWGNGWCCLAWSSTTPASYSGPKTAWPLASERVSEVRERIKTPAASPSRRDQREVRKGNNSATVSVQF